MRCGNIGIDVGMGVEASLSQKAYGTCPGTYVVVELPVAFVVGTLIGSKIGNLILFEAMFLNLFGNKERYIVIFLAYFRSGRKGGALLDGEFIGGEMVYGE